MFNRIINENLILLAQPLELYQCLRLALKYNAYSMIPKSIYIRNLLIAKRQRHVPGCVVECGVWRGGMIAGIAEILGQERQYFLFDSFEGLPPAQTIDGEAALQWQSNSASPYFFNNCKAEIDFAEAAMKLSKAKYYQLIKGWFQDTLPQFKPPENISLLRLDADWFDSTRICLESLSEYIAPGGLIIVDDYYQWDGCAKAVHQFIASQNSTWRITQAYNSVCVLETRV